MGELLTQTKPGKASSTVFDYDTRNKTLTDKAAQNRQGSIQSVSVNNNSNNKKTRMFWGPIYILWAPNTGTFIKYLL